MEENIRIFDCLESTNDTAAEWARAGAPAGAAVAARRQTAGRGRRGRSFYSPAETGLYLSVILRPECGAEDLSFLTPAAAVAAAEAVEQVCGLSVGIKWINDLWYRERKVGGILCESALRPEGSPEFVIVGIGLNLEEPEGGFPAELCRTAGALFPTGAVPDGMWDALLRTVRDRLLQDTDPSRKKGVFDSYRERLIWMGRPVRIESSAGIQEAVMIGPDPDFGLQVCLADGSRSVLRDGEVSLRRAD